MTNPTVAISVDCVCANTGKCYVPEIVGVTEQYNIPLTWLLGVAEHDPMSNLKLYHNEYFHRIPAWHELGMYLTFDGGTSNTIDRGELIRVGRDLLKQYSIKPTAFRAANGDLQASDLRTLEDYGFMVDLTPGSSAGRPLNAPKTPYHPSYNNIHEFRRCPIVGTAGCQRQWRARLYRRGVRPDQADHRGVYDAVTRQTDT